MICTNVGLSVLNLNVAGWPLNASWIVDLVVTLTRLLIIIIITAFTACSDFN